MIPINYLAQSVRTAEQWRAYRRQFCPRVNSIEAAARHYARQHGKATIFHCDDSATIIERCERNKSGFSIHHFPAEKVSWHSDSAQWQSGWNAYGKGMHCPDTFPRDYQRGYYAARSYYMERIEA